MAKPNKHGVYEPEHTEEIARVKRSFASVDLAQCDDGLWRFSIDISWSVGGICGPITKRDPGHPSPELALGAGIEHLLERFPTAWASEAESIKAELASLRAQVVSRVQQPRLL